MTNTLPLPEREPTPPIFRTSALVDALTADAEAAWEAKKAGRARGVITGFRNLDEALGGYLPAGLHIVHGNAGTGKTAFGLQVAAACGAPAVFLSTEMSPLELFRRVTARVTGTFLGRLKSGELTAQEARDRAEAAARVAPDLTIIDATTTPAQTPWLMEVVDHLRGAHPHALLVVDSLHSWAGRLAPLELGEYETINAGLAALKQLASTCDVPVLLIAERNRLSRAGGLGATRGSGKVEYQADSMIDLGKAETATENGRGEVDIELTICKNRNGPAGKKLPFAFHGALQRFAEA